MICERIEGEQLPSHHRPWSSVDGSDGLTWEQQLHLFVSSSTTEAVIVALFQLILAHNYELNVDG